MKRYEYSPSELKLIEESCIPFAIYQYIDKRVVTIALSAGLWNLCGFSSKNNAYEMMNTNMYRNIHPDDVAEVSESAARFANEGGDFNVVFRSLIKGEYRLIHAYGQHVMKDKNTRLAIVWYNDEGVYSKQIPEKAVGLNHTFSKDLDQKSMLKKAKYDYLTGLPEMTMFFDVADLGRDAIKDSGKEVAFLYMDLCGMKSINEQYGYAEGDKLIRAFSQVLIKYFGEDNCSRFAADHFAVYTELDGVEDILEKIFEDTRHINDGKTLPVRVGIYPDNLGRVNVATACDRAKMACDYFKNTAVSKLMFFDESMVQTIEKRKYLIDNLDRAINEGWIEVYFQPIVRAANDCVCDEEGLARWNDPEKGFLSPADFISILEEENIIYKLDLCILEKVIDKIKTQADEGLFVVPQSINVSGNDFYNCDMVEEIRRRVDASGIGRENITLEIAESAIAGDVDFMKQQIESLQELGFKVWMDDYGSGYTSPTVLQKIHFDLIKIDMLYVKQIENRENRTGRIVISELAKMINSLGIETVAEGVETREQVEFLKEIGCNKLQGAYYCEPISKTEIFDRYHQGVEMRIENPEEADYFASIGRANLYDLSISKNDDDYLQNYFDTLPMVIIEVDNEAIRMVRANQSFREFGAKNIRSIKEKQEFFFNKIKEGPGYSMAKAIRQCADDGNRVILDEITKAGAIVQLFIRRIAVNPVTKRAAVAVVVLSFNDKKSQNQNLTYSYVARALSDDYMNMYYVDLETEKFVEYGATSSHGSLTMERHGDNFFENSRQDALKALYKDDQESFISAFRKENILQSLKNDGNFNITYRLMMNGKPRYVNMKVVPIDSDGKHIIIGVNNVDAQMKQREALERIKEERITYGRLTALSGDYIVIYTVNPQTDSYSEYSAVKEYEDLGLDKSGENFFEQARKNGARTVYVEDIDMFMSNFKKDVILRTIEETGLYALNYRLVLKDQPIYVCAKAALVNEIDGPQLIIGVTNIDRQVKRDLEYAHNLSAARDKANLDELTGVKNKHAYVDVEIKLNGLIDSETTPEFAIVVCDLNGLKHVNDTLGHQAGDQFIKAGCEVICKTFKHSPVYRIGGDEFVVIVQGEDYENIEKLMQKISAINRKNKENNEVVIAVGMARYSINDRSVASVFERADSRMYENKKLLKGIKD